VAWVTRTTTSSSPAASLKRSTPPSSVSPSPFPASSHTAISPAVSNASPLVWKPSSWILQIELPTVKEIPSETTTESRSVIAVDAEGNITLDALPIPDGLLNIYLDVFQKQNPGRKLELEADRRLPLENLLKIWDALGKAGISIKEVPARIKVGGDGK
jgi:biopolymer transport protein ExbD